MGFERDIIVFLQGLRCGFLDWFFVLTSYLFDYPIVIILAIVLIFSKRIKELIYFLILEGSGLILQLTLKAIVNRPRPYLIYPEIINILPASNSSFPSGHSMTCMMAVVFLYFITKNSRLKKSTKNIIYGCLGLALIVCAINRMYLGQHYLTDILASFVLAGVVGYVIMRFGYLRIDSKKSSANLPQNLSE